MEGESMERNPYVEALKEAWDLTDDQLQKIVSGEQDLGMLDKEDVLEEILRRQHLSGIGFSPYVVCACATLIFSLIAFFGWTLYKSLKQKEEKREEKKKLKQKKKK